MALQKITSSMVPFKRRLIERSLIEKLVYLASTPENVYEEYEDIYYSIQKEKILKSLMDPVN